MNYTTTIITLEHVVGLNIFKISCVDGFVYSLYVTIHFQADIHTLSVANITLNYRFNITAIIIYLHIKKLSMHHALDFFVTVILILFCWCRLYWNRSRIPTVLRHKILSRSYYQDQITFKEFA